MKKLSSKIIIFFLVTLVLWGGVNFNLEKSKFTAQNFTGIGISNILGVEKAYAVGSEEMSWWKKVGVSVTDLAVGVLGTGAYSAGIIATLSGILTLLYPILAIVAAFFDASIQMSISGFKTFVDSSSIVDSWVIIRDVLNISFIFIILYIAITTIIGGAGVKTKVLIKDVIIGAILINFSLFFTRIIIDGGNILATAMFNKISSGTSSWAFGLTGRIMNSLKLQSLLNFNLFKASGQVNAIASLTFSIIIVCLTIWAFLYGAILFLLRNVMLLFLLAVSPIGFIGGTIPWIKDKSSEWWSALLQQVAVAPFFLFMIFMLMKLIDGIKGGSELFGFDLMGGLTNANNDYFVYFNGKTALNYGMFINAFLIIGMLLVGTKMTKKLAGKMGGVAEKIVGLAVTAAVTAATAGTAFLAAKGATMGATLATRGATMATGGRMARIGGTLMQGTGKMITATRIGEGAGKLATKATEIKGTVDRVLNAPGIIGRNLTAGKKGLLSSIKKETGMDLDYAAQFKADAKEDKKRIGEIANEKGPDKENEEIKNRKATLENIEARAKDQIDNDTDGTLLNEDLKNNAEITKGLTEKIAELTKTINSTGTTPADKTTAETEREVYKRNLEDAGKQAVAISEKQNDRQKAMIEDVKREIGKGMGYDTDKHAADIVALENKKRVKETARDQYIRTIKDPKIAAELRAIKGKWKDKSLAEQMAEQLKKDLKKEADEAAAKKTT